MKRAIIIIIILAILGVGGYFGYQAWQNAQAAMAGSFQTANVTRGDLTAIVGGTGTVRANQSGSVAWEATGRVGSLDVKVGDVVTQGQVLATLDEKTLPQSIILARADLVTAQRNLDNLLNSDVARTQANQALVAAEKELDDAKSDRESYKYARASDDTIEVARANLALAQKELDEAQDRYDQVKNRGEDDPLRAQALSMLANARQKRDRNQANLNYMLGGPDALDVSEADARVALAEARLADAQREVERLKNGADPLDIQAAEARVAAIESTIDLVNIEAPFAGTVTQMDIMVGDRVNPGTVAFRIDDLSRLLVDVSITEVDVNRVKVGQPVTFSFDAIQGKVYNGKVIEVGKVGATVQGVVNFTITMELTDADEQVLPGMTAAVNIVTEKLDQVLMLPNRAVRLRDGKRVVYLLDSGALMPRRVEVRLGVTSDQFSEVLDGVKEGDVLVLNPPPDMDSSSGPPPGMGGGF